jgi:hypothetical protein
MLASSKRSFSSSVCSAARQAAPGATFTGGVRGSVPVPTLGHREGENTVASAGISTLGGVPAMFQDAPPRPKRHDVGRFNPWTWLGHREVELAPDRRPAVRLRLALLESRRLGLTFAQAWPEDVRCALRGLVGRERDGWAEAFEATRTNWAATYTAEDERGHCGLHPSLLAD